MEIKKPKLTSKIDYLLNKMVIYVYENYNTAANKATLGLQTLEIILMATILFFKKFTNRSYVFFMRKSEPSIKIARSIKKNQLPISVTHCQFKSEVEVIATYHH